MNINDFEKQLSELKIKQPSKGYLFKANKIFTENKPTPSIINWSYIFAFCLMVSLALNFFMYAKIQPSFLQKNIIASHSNAQNLDSDHSTKHGIIIEHGFNNDIVLIMENR
jgi:hypothetical protein